jgi:hypothetical protein
VRRHHQQGDRDCRADEAGAHQRHPGSAVGCQRQQGDRRNGAAEEAGERVHGERTADSPLRDAVGEDGIVGGVIDAVGEPGEHGGDKEPGVGVAEAERGTTC